MAAYVYICDVCFTPVSDKTCVSVLSASFETDNGISREEEGDGVQVTGSYSYTADDGTPVQITFVADENGFQPEGDALPTPVPTEYPTPEVPSTEAAAVSYGAPSSAAASYSAPGAPSRSYGAF